MRDPQLAARRFFGSASTESLGAYGVDQFPALFNGVRPPRYEGVHETGDDTFDVVTAVLGLPDEQFAELAARGIFT
jgi:crotonobetainyl-CoA:carnitine CoA-transferase CaiB-like acyl-CoA transferase